MVRKLLKKPLFGAAKSSSQSPPVETDPDRESVVTKVDTAPLALDVTVPVPLMGPTPTAADLVAMANTAVTDIQNLNNPYLQPLEVFHSIVTAIEDVHPYAQTALGILTAASQLIITQANLYNATPALLQKLGFVYKLLLEEDMMKNINRMRDTLAKIARVVSAAAQFIMNYTEMKSFWRRLGKDITSETQSAVDGYINTLDDLMQQYRDCEIRDIQVNIPRVLEDVNLEGMAYAAGAGFNITKKCLDGTRTEILQRIIHWATDLDVNAPRILWLRGQSGRGKSAIAHTVASWIKDAGGFGSCFCFARDRQAERREQKIFATIARDLADRDLAFRRALVDVVTRNYDLKATSDVMQQWQHFILGPLSKVDGLMVGNVVVVIDALDESGPETSRRHILSLLSSTEAAHLPANMRILLTSRPLPDIERALGARSHVKVTSLDNVSAESMEHDIRLYVSKELGHLPEIEDNEIQVMVHKSDGLFEWARLACDFVKPNRPGRTVRERFHEVAFPPSGGGGTLLDVMYRTILEDAIPNDKATLARFHSVMQQIMSAFEPLRMDALNKMRAHFPYEEDRFDMVVILEFMSPLLGGIADRTSLVRPLHTSFYDFLTDPERSGIYFVGASDMHSLTFASLQILCEGLQFNICGLESSYLSNSEVLDLPEKIDKNISPHLSYSCRFWAQHLHKTTFDSALVTWVKALVQSEKVLFWLEVLSLLDALGGATDALASTAVWLLDQIGCEDVLAIVQDGIKFIQNFGSVISCSAPHLYISALPFSPLNTALSRLMMPKFTGLVVVSGGGLTEWPVIQLALQGHTATVCVVAMSPDGKRIASGSNDKTVRIWDAESGGQIGGPLQGHAGGVQSVGFSPDGKKIVSGSHDKTVRIWDAEKGVQIGEPLQGHAAWIWSVGFSPDGKRVVSGSDDNTVRIWDVERGVQVGGPLQGHDGWVQSVRFSPDGKRIVSGSNDKTLRIWDAERGVQIGKPLQGHSGWVQSVGFSPDGKRIVSGSHDKTVRIWNAERGVQLGGPYQGHTNWVQSVGFSPDGKRIISGSWDETVRIWDAERGVQISGPFQGQTGGVQSVEFSPDGKRIVTGSNDNTVRIWDVESCVQIGGPLQGHTDQVKSAGFSPNAKMIVSGSWDKTVRIWDAGNGVQIGGPLQGHTSRVQSVGFSPDGKRIISASHDRTVRIWNAESGVQIGDPLQGHTGWILSVGFSPDGKMIVSGSCDKSVRIWDAESGMQIGEPLHGHAGWVWSVGFSPDGKRIISGSDDMTVRIWDVKSGVQIGDPLQGHAGWVQSVRFSAAGNRIFSGSSDETVRVWDAESFRQIGIPIQGHTGDIYSVTISPDGTKIALASAASAVRVLDAQNFGILLPVHNLKNVPVPSPAVIQPYPVCFSSVPSHALSDVLQLLDGLQEDDSVRDEPVRLHPDGWIRGPRGRLLLWIPPILWRRLYSIWTIAMIPGDHCIELDLSQIVHGNKWHQCFQPVA
ncbi:hypothetical protein M404DRAFT_544679 [Pisolithus tinctorius Marx 270]|uniref:NACHT domain-containing protein n=1 Tax=Pisolithus tinctorius Marx 270 TaxID=870435 RepID=A0A0C3PAJ4_PISTI|nr:hypothetical protein M404DRAFT_544679 [Pisolithus tinctorius Marx 270]